MFGCRYILQQLFSKMEFVKRKIWFKLTDVHLQSFTKYLRLTLVFVRNNALREKFNFCFTRVFCYYKQIFHFGKKTWD